MLHTATHSNSDVAHCNSFKLRCCTLQLIQTQMLYSRCFSRTGAKRLQKYHRCVDKILIRVSPFDGFSLQLSKLSPQSGSLEALPMPCATRLSSRLQGWTFQMAGRSEGSAGSQLCFLEACYSINEKSASHCSFPNRHGRLVSRLWTLNSQSL